VTGTVTVAFNTTASAQTVAGWTDPLPAGLLRVGGEDLSLCMLCQNLRGDVTFEQVSTTTGGTVIRLGLADVDLTLGPLTASDGTGLFVISPTGVAGGLTAPNA